MKIGHELGSEEMLECSVVTVPYKYGGDLVGVLAILGPRRMPYARLLALATGTAASLNRHLIQSEKSLSVASDYYKVLGVERGAIRG